MKIKDAHIVWKDHDVDWWGDPLLDEGVVAIAFSAIVDGELVTGRTKVLEETLSDEEFSEEELVKPFVQGIVEGEIIEAEMLARKQSK